MTIKITFRHFGHIWKIDLTEAKIDLYFFFARIIYYDWYFLVHKLQFDRIYAGPTKSRFLIRSKSCRCKIVALSGRPIFSNKKLCFIVLSGQQIYCKLQSFFELDCCQNHLLKMPFEGTRRAVLGLFRAFVRLMLYLIHKSVK